MTVAVYLGLPKESGGLFQYARTVLHSLARRSDHAERLVALSPRGTEWGAICANIGVERHEVDDLTLAQRVAGRLLRGRVPRHRWARAAMPRVTPLGRALDCLGADICIYGDSEHFAYELATPLLIPIHDLMHRYESRFSENRAYKDPDRLLSRICNGAGGILVDSEVGRQQVLDSYGPFSAQVFVLPYVAPDYVYDESVLAPDPGIGTMLASLPAKYLFYPAQFWEHKNHVRLIDAVHNASEKYPDVHLALAGSRKNNYDAVVAHVAELGFESHVTLLGYVSDRAKLELYRHARALVMPTFYGPTNIPPLEAFQLGCPVATSRIYGVPEQLGEAALLFDPSSVAEIQEAVERLWSDDDLCHALVRLGSERARTWGSEQFSQRLWSIVDTVVASPR